MVFNGNLLNWNWGKKNLPIRREDSSPLEGPAYFPLQRDLNRVFDDFFRTFENAGLLSPLGEISESMFHPKLEMKENPDALCISLELPGIDEKDIDLSITNDALTISGEKREEKEENTQGYYRMERTYGSFHRQVPIPCQVDKDKIEATFKKGVLNIVLPKTEEAKQQIKKISIKKD